HLAASHVCDTHAMAQRLQFQQSPGHRQLGIVRMREDGQYVELNFRCHFYPRWSPSAAGSVYCLLLTWFIWIVPSFTVSVSVPPPLPARARRDCGVMLVRSRGSRLGYAFLTSPVLSTAALISPLKPGINPTLRLPLATLMSAPSPCQLNAGMMTSTVPLCTITETRPPVSDRVASVCTAFRRIAPSTPASLVGPTPALTSKSVTAGTLM